MQAAHKPQQKKLCKYLSQYGNCRYGDACHFFHPPALQAKQPAALTQGLSKPFAPKALTNKRSISTGRLTDTKITIDNTNPAEELGKRKRSAPRTVPQTKKAALTKLPQQRPAAKKLKNQQKNEESSGEIPAMGQPKQRRPIHERLGPLRSPTSTSPDSSPSASSLSSPDSSSPPSSPLTTFTATQRSRENFFELDDETQPKDAHDYSFLFGSYALDPSAADKVAVGVQHGFTLLAGSSPNQGTWEIHQDSFVSPSPFSFGMHTAAKKTKRIALGGTFRVLPITAEDKQKNVFWLELTKTKERVQEQGAPASETITPPCVQRVPYQISRTANQVGVLINAFGQEQILLVKGV